VGSIEIWDMRAGTMVFSMVCLSAVLGCGAPGPADDPSTKGQQAAAAPAPAPTASASAEVKKPEPAPPAEGLSADQINDAVSKNMKAFDACYSLGADANGKLSGMVTVKATVSPTGEVKEAGATKSTVKNKKVAACVVEAFRKIKFPPPEGGAAAVITFPMNFDTDVVYK
jgi:TonB family protein